MAVRVRIRIRSSLSGGQTETAALVNTGFETHRPQLLIPLKLAKTLKLWSEPKAEIRTEIYETAGGLTKVHVVDDALDVELSLDREQKPRSIVSDAVISEIEEEVIISDSLGQELDIIILRPKDGLWRTSDDSPDTARSSEKPQRWV